MTTGRIGRHDSGSLCTRPMDPLSYVPLNPLNPLVTHLRTVVSHLSRDRASFRWILSGRLMLPGHVGHVGRIHTA